MNVILGIGLDKWLHLVVSFLLTWLDLKVSILLGVVKEIWDQVADGTAEWADLAADLAGILLALALGA